MQSEESNTLVKLAKAVIEHAPEGCDAFWDIKFSDIEAALSAAEPVAWVDEQELRYLEMVSGNKAWVDFQRNIKVGGEKEGRAPLYAAPPAPSVAVKVAMTDDEVNQWIGACNHEPARETLRHYLTLRSNNISDLPKAEAETLRACDDWKATFEIMSIRGVSNTAEAWRSSQKIVDNLLDRGLLEFGEPNTTYRITDAGRCALSAQVQDVADMPQSPWPASDWAIGRIKELEAQAIPEGWQLVPVEPTPEMIAAAKSTTSAVLTRSHATEIYRAMLAAAPAKQEG